MISEKEKVSISKFLSLVLRHQPEIIGIKLDENGWTNVAVLLEKASKAGVKLDFAILTYIVDTNSKQRFAFNSDRSGIRASQGHSIAVDLGYEPQTPPEILYHGTAKKSVESIFANGLEKRSRQHVHLSKDAQTAISVGKRHGQPLVLEVQAGEMQRDNFRFYLSENGVWLTDHVPAKYLKLISA
jgi:putative RNA 2'-phosphotransferase